MNFTLKHALALLTIGALVLPVAVPLAASGMSLEDAASLFLEVLRQWLT